MSKTNTQRQRDYYAKHSKTKAFRDRRCRMMKNYYAKHTFARLANNLRTNDKTNTVNKFQLWRLAKQQRLICPLTGRKLTNETISPDHKIPLSHGGKSSIENIRLVHVDANMARRNFTDSQFIQLCQDVAKRAASLSTNGA